MIKPPCQFSYSPNAINSFLVAGFIAVIAGVFSFGINKIGVVTGSVTFVLSLAFLLLRKAFAPRLLKMEEEYIVLPYGLLQIYTKRIAYSQITKISEIGRQLNLETAEGKYLLAEVLLPDKQTFSDIKDFLSSRVQLRN